ncbi:chromatin remodeling 1 [Striga asiatica]|uniref:Chromatin remodeling 1 n=1 Tax=Striga asiatica TaxID=4170 RepID=A0A5A7Q029_STRAF|nr:chromatin remodeling 1 [Striga asiatica]
MVAENEGKNEPVTDSPTSVLEDEDCKESPGVELEVEVDAENGVCTLVSKTIVKEEEKLLEVRLKEEDGKDNESKGEPLLNDIQFTKLDELLTQTQLYSEFLLEKMDDITKNGLEDDGKAAKEVKRGRGSKRKAAASYDNRKAKRAVAAMLTRHKDGDSTKDLSLTEEERNQNEQEELVPLLTGGKLKSYQIKGVKWMISLWQNGLNGILADQMGLGKTIQTIAFLAHLKGNGMHGPYLVIAPLSTLSNWLSEIERFVPSVNAIIYHGDRKERDEIIRNHMPRTIGPKFPIVITSYEVAMIDARRQLKHYSWKYLVVDEGHRLKNSNCKLVKQLKYLSVENKLLLTGTPLQNNLAELWSLLNFILPDIFSSHQEFESCSACITVLLCLTKMLVLSHWLFQMKCNEENTYLTKASKESVDGLAVFLQFDFSGKCTNEALKEDIEEKRRAQVVAKLHAILRPFLLRRMKSDVEQMLPQKKEIILYATMTEHQKSFQEHLINKTLEVHLVEKTSNAHGMKGKLNNLMIQLRKNCNHPDLLESAFDGSYLYPPVEQIVGQCGKFQLLDKLLFKLFARKHKVLVFSQWTKILDIMDYYLSEKGFQIKEFNDANSNYRIFLLSTRAGGLGINLTAADTCILYDSDWNPQMDLQAMDRCHRIGQTKPVHVYRLATAQSVEGRILKRAFSKLKLEHVVIGKGQFKQERSKADGADTMTEEELLALLGEEDDKEEKWIQTDISDEDLDRVLDRSDLVPCVNSSSEKDENINAVPLKGPGWEVVIPTAAGGMLSTLSS